MKKLPVNPTARELLISAAGVDHEFHSIITLARSRQSISLTCSCRKVFSVPNTEEHLRAVRNVPMDDL